MLAEDYYSFKKNLESRGLVFSFTGFFSEGLLYSLGEALKHKMTLEEADANVIKRVFSVFVEQAQNVIRYSAERIAGELDKPIELSSGMIAVGLQDERFFVVCGNTLLPTQVPRLRERLEHLNSLDRNELKAFYKEKLREPPEEDSKGATIGLIEIARRASAPIEFDFLDVSGQETFFCLKAYI